MDDLDPRLLRIEIEVGSQIHSFDGELAIRIQGMFFANLLWILAKLPYTT